MITYTLLSKDFPWIADKEEKLYELIKRAEVDFSKPVWNKISEHGEFFTNSKIPSAFFQ